MAILNPLYEYSFMRLRDQNELALLGKAERISTDEDRVFVSGIYTPCISHLLDTSSRCLH